MPVKPILSLVPLLLAGSAALAAPPIAADGPRDGDRDRATYTSARTCARCHGDPNNLFMENPRLIRHDEYQIWSRQDRHSRAFEALKTPESLEITMRLGWPRPAQEERRCLSCHGTDSSIDADLGRTSPADRAGSLDPDGVGCLACHGGGGSWLVAHALGDPKAWMEQSAAAKQRLGLNDLRDPIRRTKVCLSCHIGDPDHGKDLTHDLYAAGHPPLRSIEVKAFSQAMPKHWEEPEAVPYILQASRKTQKDGYHYDPEELSRARWVATVGVATLVEEATALRRSPERGSGALDFARFDCTACHHDLQAADGDSWRQRRGFPAGAGRPPLPYWPTALAGLGIGAANDAGARGRFSRLANDLDRAVGRSPFADPSRLDPAAEALAREAGGLIQTLDAARFDRPTAEAMLRSISDAARAGPADVETARQLAWAFLAIATELDPTFRGRPEARTTLETLGRDLDLGVFPPTEPPAGTAPVVRRALDYDPARYREQFDALNRQLAPR